ncbi:ABC transporter substrate-binding protein [Desulfosporosinus shakirovi]|uniref:ABC transporter substrate-binding protein n=1 Tax=Desulfosporosinus shakirovi TaxID=2885154 RepID=UPI001E490B6A|nr:ABC transporter substrate-binding protein [Desulfosporosinus sp. SRJS8]MCB8816078.1 ABC transporter substrate-binding protein [Desulfosporosinus sp. SRJS8]
MIKHYKRRKALLSLLLVTFLMLSLAGCQSRGNEIKTSSNQSSGTKIVTDLLGNQVTIKANVEKIAVVPIPWATIVYAVDGSGEKIVGMHPSAMKAYEKNILKAMAPEMANINSTFVDNNFNVNYEEVAKLKPDLVVIWDYQPEVGKKLAEIGIPSVAIKYGTLEDVQKGIELVGEILNQQERATALIQYQQDTNSYLKSKESSLTSRDKPKTLYLRDEQLQVATGESVNKIMIDTAGGVNVANEVTGDNWKKVTMEQVIAWNPEVIILSNFSEILPEDLYENKYSGQDWSTIEAVKNKRVYKAPMGIYRWDAPCVETPLMMKWLGKDWLYPISAVCLWEKTIRTCFLPLVLLE